MTTLTIDIEDDVMVALQKDPTEVAGEMRILAAIKWYELGRISQDKAADIAGLTRANFLVAASQFGVSPYQESSEEILLWMKGQESVFSKAWDNEEDAVYDKARPR